MADRIGQQLGLYRLIRLINKGNFADVYLGEHVRMLTQAAVKVFELPLTRDEEERFGEEARVVSRLSHPHIMPLLDSGVQDGTPFLVVDYAPNGSLRDQFPQGTPQAPGAILPYMWQVADALQFAHVQRVMHCNLKPENLLLDTHNGVLLSDFALPVIFQSPRYQAALERTGTAAYLAPEQIRGQAIPASDQYALAAMIYEWLCGSPLFQGSITEVMAKQLFNEPTPLRERVRTLSPAIEVVLLGALSKDPADRFTSVESFARAIEEASQAVPVLLFMAPVRIDAPELDAPNVTEAASASEASAAPPQASAPVIPEPELEPALPFAASEPPEPTAAPRIISAPLTMPPPPAAPPDSQPDAFAAPAPPDAQPIITPPPAPPAESPIITPRPAKPAAPPLVITLPPPSPAVERPPVSSAPPVPPETPPAAPILVSAPGGAWSSTRPESPTAMPTPAFTVPGRPRPTTAPLTSVPPVPAQPMSAFPASAQPAPVQPAPAFSAPAQPAPAQSRPPEPALGATWREVDWIPTPPPPSATPAFSPMQEPRGGISRRSLLVGGMVGLLGVAGALTWLGVSKLSSHPPAATPAARATTRPTSQPTATPTPKAGDTVFTYHGHTGFLRSVSWSPDGKRIASASDDGTVQIWDAFTGAQPYTYNRHTAAVMAVAWSPDGTLIASGSQDNTVLIWSPSNGQLLHSYTFGKPVVAVAWSRDGTYLAAASLDFTIGVWNTKTWIRLHRVGAFGAVNALSWSPDNIHLVSGDANQQAIIWNVVTGGRIHTYHGHTSSILALAWSPDGVGIASGADVPDTTLQYWNSTSLAQLWSVTTQGATPSLAWSPKGTLLAAGGSGVNLLYPSTGQQVLNYAGDAAALAWSPDGAYIACGGQSTTVQVWRTQ